MIRLRSEPRCRKSLARPRFSLLLTTLMWVGLPALASAAPPHWLAYVSTPDVRATARRARALGGTVLAEFDIPDVGSVAVIADPQGAILAAYQPTDFAPGHDGAGRVGEFSWHELMTSDPEAARDFYFDLFGWEDTGVADLGEMGPYRMYGREGRSMGGIMRCPPGVPTSWLCYVRVADLDAALVRVEAEGGTVLAGPMEVPGGDRVAPCMDAQGAAFALHEVAGD